MKVFRLFLSVVVVVWSVLLSPLYAQQNLTYLSYNILEGFENDSIKKANFVNWVKPIQPDIVAFQETNKFTQHSLERFAKEYDHPYAILAKESGYPVALTSKYPIVNVQRVLDNMWHGYIYATILDYHVFVLHLSPHVQEKRNYEIAQIIAHAKSLPKGAKIIMSGDFNAFSGLDQSVYTEQVVSQMKRQEAERPNLKNLKNGQIDFGVLDQLYSASFIDVFNYKVGKFKSSFPTEKYRTPNSYERRIDYVFVSNNLRKNISQIDIVHDSVTHHLSDHYPIIMQLKK